MFVHTLNTASGLLRKAAALRLPAVATGGSHDNVGVCGGGGARHVTYYAGSTGAASGMEEPKTGGGWDDDEEARAAAAVLGVLGFLADFERNHAAYALVCKMWRPRAH